MTMMTSRLLATVLLVASRALPIDGFAPSTASGASRRSIAARRAAAAAEGAGGGDTLSLFSPCKINLFLRIIRKRPDGFHDLASLFQAVGFGDTLHLSLKSGDDGGEDDADVFTCNMDGVPTDSTNLVLRALELMRQKTGREDVHFVADLVKRVPAQAGLGGGSANAATAMWGANELMGRPATLEQVG